MYAIVPAAGNSSRMGSACENTSKVLLTLDTNLKSTSNTKTKKLPSEKTVLSKTLESLRNSKTLKGIVVACRDEDRAGIDLVLSEVCPELDCWSVTGGAQRQNSVYNALISLEGKTEMVLIHDGARPLCSPELIQSVFNKANESGAAILAVPSKSTLKNVVSREDEIIIRETIPRETIWEAQTPQVFSFSILKAAHDKAIKEDFISTDDSSLVERLGHVVQIVEGSIHNIKITTEEDFDQVQLLFVNS